MNVIELLNGLVAQIQGLQQALVDAQAAVELVRKEAYDKGFADGVASVPVSGDKIYSQADLDKAVADAVGPLNEKIVALQAQVDGIPGQIDAAVAQAKVDIKAQIKTLLQAEEADLEAKVDQI